MEDKKHIGILGALLTTLAFVCVLLKLTGVVPMSWVLALSPIWFPIALVLAIVAVILGGCGFVWCIAKLLELRGH